MPAKLFVGNLSFQATEEDLRELFQQAGTVESVRIVTDQFTGRPRGFGFVEMATKEESAKAIEMLNGGLFSGAFLGGMLLVTWRASWPSPYHQPQGSPAASATWWTGAAVPSSRS